MCKLTILTVLMATTWLNSSGAKDIVGRTLTLDGAPFTIVGVTPPAFFGMEVGRTFDVAAPLGANRGPRGANVSWLTIVGLFRPASYRSITGPLSRSRLNA
jgi:hypothetical protein